MPLFDSEGAGVRCLLYAEAPALSGSNAQKATIEAGEGTVAPELLPAGSGAAACHVAQAGARVTAFS